MKETEKPYVEIFTDGACSGNPGIGGYGALLRSSDREKEIHGCEPLTTNNRMELVAVIKALEALKKPCRVKITTDSNYVVKGITAWIFSRIDDAFNIEVFSDNQPRHCVVMNSA